MLVPRSNSHAGVQNGNYRTVPRRVYSSGFAHSEGRGRGPALYASRSWKGEGVSHFDDELSSHEDVLNQHVGHLLGSLTLDERQMRISVRGVPIALSPLEYRLAAYLILHRGRVVSQQELSENIYGHDDAHDSNALEVLIGRVRRKLGSDLIETRRGFGYMVLEQAG